MNFGLAENTTTLIKCSLIPFIYPSGKACFHTKNCKVENVKKGIQEGFNFSAKINVFLMPAFLLWPFLGCQGFTACREEIKIRRSFTWWKLWALDLDSSTFYYQAWCNKFVKLHSVSYFSCTALTDTFWQCWWLHNIQTNMVAKIRQYMYGIVLASTI